MYCTSCIVHAYLPVLSLVCLQNKYELGAKFTLLFMICMVTVYYLDENLSQCNNFLN